MHRQFSTQSANGGVNAWHADHTPHVVPRLQGSIARKCPMRIPDCQTACKNYQLKRLLSRFISMFKTIGLIASLEDMAMMSNAIKQIEKLHLLIQAQLAELLQAYQAACEVLQPPASWIESYLNALSTSADNVIPSHIHPISVEAWEAIEEALVYLHDVTQEIDTFLEAVGHSAQARQSAFYWAVAIIIASVFALHPHMV